MMFEMVEPFLRRLFRLAPRRADKDDARARRKRSLFGLYTRIFIMQVTIILGAWFALLIGTVGAYVFLIALKTAIDVAFQVLGGRHSRRLDQGEGEVSGVARRVSGTRRSRAAHLAEWTARRFRRPEDFSSAATGPRSAARMERAARGARP